MRQIQQLCDLHPPSGDGLLVQPVVDEVASLLVDHQARVAHDAEVLGDCALRYVKVCRQGIDAQCPAAEELEDADAGLDTEHLQQPGEVSWFHFSND